MAQKTVTGAFGAIFADRFFVGMVFPRFRFKGHFRANNKVNWPHLGGKQKESNHQRATSWITIAATASNISILTTALGYKQVEITKVLGLKGGSTVGNWPHGTKEPVAENWAKLQELSQNLTATGELRCSGKPVETGGEKPSGKAKKQKKGANPRGQDTVTVKSKYNNSNSKKQTVSIQEIKGGDPNCKN